MMITKHPLDVVSDDSRADFEQLERFVEQSDELFHGTQLQLNRCIKHQTVLIPLFQIVPCASVHLSFGGEKRGWPP